MVTIIIVLIKGPAWPSSNNSVVSGELLLNENVNWKPLASPAVLVILTEDKASITGFGTGIGTAGPIKRLRLILPLSI